MEGSFVERGIRELLGGKEFTPEEVYVLITGLQFKKKHGIDPFPNGIEDFNIAIHEIQLIGLLDKLAWEHSIDNPLDDVPEPYGQFLGTTNLSQGIAPDAVDYFTSPEKIKRERRISGNETHRSRDKRGAEHDGRVAKCRQEAEADRRRVYSHGGHNLISRHTKPKDRVTGTFSIDDLIGDDETPSNGTNYLLTEKMGFDRGDIIYMMAAYANRVIPVGNEEVDLLKLATHKFDGLKADRRFYRTNPERVRTDLICYLEVLNSTWSGSGSAIADSYIQNKNSAGLFKAAKYHYDKLSSILRDSRTTIMSPTIFTALTSSTYLFEKYALRKNVKPPQMVLVYGDMSRPTLGGALPQNVRNNLARLNF